LSTKEYYGLRLLKLQASLLSRPFVSLTQDARIAEKNKNRVKNKGNLLPKQRHFTAEGAEIAEETTSRAKDKTILPSFS